MKYRKKPIVVEAFQYDGDFIDRNENPYVPVWAIYAEEMDVLYFTDDGELYVKTLEGDMHVSVGDYIIRGIFGELYACKPDIFYETYEKVD